MDAAGEIASLVEVLGFAPPAVSVDDLEQFIRASFCTSSATPYRSDDPDADPLDRGIGVPLVGEKAVAALLGRYRSELASTGSNPWQALDATGELPLEDRAWEAFHAGDIGTFRFFLFTGLERMPVLSERSLILSLIVSLDSYDETLRQSWLDRINSWRDGSTAPEYDPTHTDDAVIEYATENRHSTSAAAAARLVDFYVRRVLRAEDERRARDRARRLDPQAPARVAVLPDRGPSAWSR